MKALVYYGQKDVRYETIPDPSELGSKEVRVRVKFAGVCHTDFNEYLHGPMFISTTPHVRTGRSIPLVIGHEFSGEIVEAGKEAHRVRVGDRVAVNAVDSCGYCTYCRRGLPALCLSVAYIGFNRDGGFADFAVVPQQCCYRLSSTVSFQAGALVEPLAVSVHAVRQANLAIGIRAAVVGGGTVGLCTLQALKAAGARDVLVIDKAKAKERFARDLGALAFLDPSAPGVVEHIRELTDGLGVAVAFECVGSLEAFRTAVNVTSGEGTICVVGIYSRPLEIDLNLLLKQEKRIVTSLGYSDEFPTIIRMLEDGRLAAEPLITRTLSLEEGVTAGLQGYAEETTTGIRTLIGMEGPRRDTASLACFQA